MDDLHEDASRMGELPRAPRPTGYATLTVEGIELWWEATKKGGLSVLWESKPGDLAPGEARATAARQ